MLEISITKDAASLLKAIHKVYKKRRHKGKPKQDAIIFGDSSNIQQEIKLRWSLEDINDACWELDNVGLLSCIPGDDDIQLVILTDDGIAYAEGKTSGTVHSVIDLIKSLLSFITWST